MRPGARARGYDARACGRIGHGMGDTVDLKSVKWLRPGQSVTLPANSHHYVRTRGRTLVEVSAVGPFVVTYVNGKDDPRVKAK